MKAFSFEIKCEELLYAFLYLWSQKHKTSLARDRVNASLKAFWVTVIYSLWTDRGWSIKARSTRFMVITNMECKSRLEQQLASLSLFVIYNCWCVRCSFSLSSLCIKQILSYDLKKKKEKGVSAPSIFLICMHADVFWCNALESADFLLLQEGQRWCIVKSTLHNLCISTQAKAE